MWTASEREQIIEERIQDIGAGTFPDDDVKWRVCSVRHHGPHGFAEAEATPATVGYPRFIFVLHFDALDRMQDCACYCLDRGKWSLLCTTPGAPEDWQKIPLPA